MEKNLDRFGWFINTILKPQVYQMVLHRPIACTALINWDLAQVYGGLQLGDELLRQLRQR